MVTLLAGGTGLVGRKAVMALLNAGHHVVSVGRRPTGIEDASLTEIEVEFAAIPPLPAAGTAVCALGTTLATAGSREAFRAVDLGAVTAFLAAARAAGAAHAILVSAVGASPSSANFYSRVKGEAEREAEALGFARLDIIRPGLILGERAERRPFEARMQRLAPWINPLLIGPLDRYGAVPAGSIADAIAALAETSAPGRFVHGNREIRACAAARPANGAHVTIGD